MGICRSKPKPKISLLNKSQRESLAAMFRSNSDRSIPFTKPEIVRTWEGILTDYLLDLFIGHLFKTKETIILDDLEKFYYNMVESTTENRAIIIMSMLGTDESIHPQTLRKYIVNLLTSYMNVLDRHDNDAYKSWYNEDYIFKQDINNLADYCMKEITYSDSGKMEITELNRWLMVCSFLRDVFESVLHFVCNINVLELKPMLPTANGQQSALRSPLVLLLSHLTKVYTKREWRELYDSWNDPHSWVILQSSITNQGPNFVVIEEPSGYLFGGFASQSWKINTGFFGDNGCFLFRLRPDIIICNGSTVNKRYQYLFDGQGMFPRGLAFGGFLNYFGLFLSPDFGPGQVSVTCDTFLNYEPLSSEKKFYFSRLEVWGIGDPEPRKSTEMTSLRSYSSTEFKSESSLAVNKSTKSYEESDKWNFL